MSDLDQQLHDYARQLDAGAPTVTVEEVQQRRSGGSRRPVFVVAAAVVLVVAAVAGGVVLGGSEDAARVAADGALGEAVLVYADGGTLVRVELGTGTDHRRRLSGTESVMQLLVVGDTVVALVEPSHEPEASFVPEAIAIDLDLTDAPRPLGKSVILVRSVQPDRVWLWDGDWEGELREVTTDGETTATTPAPPGAPAAAIPDGFVIDLANYQLGTWNAAGQESTPLAREPQRSAHQLIAVHDSTIIWLGCDAALALPCGLHLTDADGGTRSLLLDWEAGRAHTGAVTRDGTTLAVILNGATPQLVLVDLHTAQVVLSRRLAARGAADAADPPSLVWVASDKCVAWTTDAGTSVDCPIDGSTIQVDTPPRTPLGGL